MTFPNGGQRDENHPARKAGRDIYAPSPAWKRHDDLIRYEEQAEVYSDLGLDMPKKVSGAGRNVVSGRRPS